MRKIPISGGPHTGKTTLFEALKARYPQAYFVEEPAECVISSELNKEEHGQSYKGVYPWNNYPEFAKLVVDKSLELEAAIPVKTDIAFMDRSLIDNIGYGNLNSFTDLVPEIKRQIKAAQYVLALFCEPVGQYTPTLIRRESPELAQLTHEALRAAYEESGVEVLYLPAVPVPERLDIVHAAIS